MKRPTEVFASLDIETDGPHPLEHSLLSIGVSVFNENEERPRDEFYVNLVPRRFGTMTEECKKFWSENPASYQALLHDQQEPQRAMKQLSDFLYRQNAKIVWVASPACFDWMFFKTYYESFGPTNKYAIGFYCHDLISLLRTYSLLKGPGVKKLRENLASGLVPSHHALEDARYQGTIYINLRRLLNANQYLPRCSSYRA